MIAGIDEAGKGPVLGPMCVGGVLLDEKGLEDLSRIGVRDSKKLTAKKREALVSGIKDLALEYYVLKVSPFQIDELRKMMTMNEIMVLCYSKVLEKLKPTRAFVDAADVNSGRFGENLKNNYNGDIDITSEHNADEKFPVVSAASILAKVERDGLVKKIEENMGLEIGSGYPSDPKTITFLENWIIKHGTLPDFARSSWETSKRLLQQFSKAQKRIWEY